MPNKIPVIFEDENILVLDKPPGIVVTPEGFTKDQTVADILKSKYKINLDRGGVVHRLDRDTSGVLIAAKTQLVLENLKSQFQKRQVTKKYICLVHGIITKPGEIVAPILRNPKNRIKFDILEGGRESVTRYEPVQNFILPDNSLIHIFRAFPKLEIKKMKQMGYEKYTLLNCYPETGRTHQIRVHLKYINHPILSDMKYGGRKNSKFDPVWCPRQFLHAQNISFIHPVTLNKLFFESPLPGDLKKVLSVFH